MVSSFSQCRCIRADSGWSSPSCCSDLVLRQRSPAFASPGPPGATGNGHCPGVTIHQPLQRKTNNIKFSYCSVCTFLTATMFHKNYMHAYSLSNLERDGSSAPDISRELPLLYWHSAPSTEWHFTNAVIFITIKIYSNFSQMTKWPKSCCSSQSIL